ncbi:MAG: V-type ATP synthase subunit A [Gammaproteobacteria bacterium]|nr:V-type ATP synthase subunit A [Gammaproteobacteria bacterium]
MAEATVTWINGPVLRARRQGSFHIKEAVHVGAARLVGEVIALRDDSVTVQVFEDTTGLRPGDLVQGLGTGLVVELGPGLLGQLFDGIQRPLRALGELYGDLVPVGLSVPPLDRERAWAFRPVLEAGLAVPVGAVIGEVQETVGIVNRVLVPAAAAGTLEWIAEEGEYRIEEPVARTRSPDGIVQEIALLRRAPIRAPAPVGERFAPAIPLVTGQRILDTLFPVGKGGAATLPGGFGTGKTILQQTLAKWCDADIILYIGCGERGNEMASILTEFPGLTDPRNGRPLMERTVVIANTSNMPVAAREASIYTGISIAEYFRDQGYHVAVLADSISRWAEALREISGRLEELPAEEGYPAYLPSRLAEFFERAGRVTTLAGAEASVTVVGAVSPPGGDFSEPVSAHARRFARCFWALDRERAQARFYPAVHPLQSYSGYVDQLERWWQDRDDLHWRERRDRLLRLLEKQAKLERMAKIVGRDALPAEQRLVLACAEIGTEAILRQNAYSEQDAFCAPRKQVAMLRVLCHFFDQAEAAVARGIDPDALLTLPVVRKLQRMGEDIAGDDPESFRALQAEIDIAIAGLELPAEVESA